MTNAIALDVSGSYRHAFFRSSVLRISADDLGGFAPDADGLPPTGVDGALGDRCGVCRGDLCCFDRGGVCVPAGCGP